MKADEEVQALQAKVASLQSENAMFAAGAREHRERLLALWGEIFRLNRLAGRPDTFDTCVADIRSRGWTELYPLPNPGTQR